MNEIKLSAKTLARIKRLQKILLKQHNHIPDMSFLDRLDGLGITGIHGANLGFEMINHDKKAIDAHHANAPFQIITAKQFENGDFDLSKPFLIEMECSNFAKPYKKV